MTVRWLVRRLVLMMPTLWAATIVVFFMMHLTPGDPALAILGPLAGPEALESLRRDLGLNDPLPTQYARWLGTALQGNLGRSIRLQVPVLALVTDKFRNTLILGAAGFSLAVTGGLLLGFFAGLKRGSWIDRAVIVVASTGIAAPSFFIALLLSYFFGIVLGILPSTGMYALEGGGGALDLLRHLILPALALSVGPTAVVARMTRSSTLEVLGQDYIRTARAKGFTEPSIARRHILKNALIPLVHLLGLQAGILLSATALVEVVFSWPGIGQLIVESILARDLPVTQGAVLLIAVVYAFVSLFADIAHTAIDPRLHTP